MKNMVKVLIASFILSSLFSFGVFASDDDLGPAVWVSEYVEETCTTPGYKIYTNSDGVSWREDIDALGHNWGDEYQNESGDIYRQCSRCLLEELVRLAPAVWVSEYVEETCTTPGYKIYTNSDGISWREDIDALGHDWGEWFDSTGDREEGTYQKRICGRCGAEEEHGQDNPIAYDYYEATCTEPAYIQYYYINNKGVKKLCGDPEPEGEPLGHDWGDWFDSTGDREENTYQKRVCSRCGAEEEVGQCNPIAYDYYEATCTKPAYYQNYYINNKGVKKLCGNPKPEGEPLGHDFGAWTKSSVQNVAGKIIQERICSRCGEKETKQIDDTISVKTVETQATCTGVGSSYKINVDSQGRQVGNKFDVKSFASLGHDWSEWKTAKDSTVLDTGLKERTCNRCHTKESASIEKKSAELNLSDVSVKVKKTVSVPVVKIGAGDSVNSWSSSNNKVATVNSNGVVKGVKNGTVTITARTKGGAVATSKVTVKKTDDKSNNKKSNKKTSKKNSKKTNKKSNKKSSKKTNKKTNKKSNKKSNKKLNKKTSKKTNKKTNKKSSKKTNKKSNKKTNKKTK